MVVGTLSTESCCSKRSLTLPFAMTDTGCTGQWVWKLLVKQPLRKVFLKHVRGPMFDRGASSGLNVYHSEMLF